MLFAIVLAEDCQFRFGLRHRNARAEARDALQESGAGTDLVGLKAAIVHDAGDPDVDPRKREGEIRR